AGGAWAGRRSRGAVMEWSYALLPEPERVLLRRLSVFAGGWTLEAAEAVCASTDEGGRMQDDERPARPDLHPSSFILHPSEVLDRLDSLVDKSLVLFENSTAPHSEIRNAHRAPESALPRYRRLETVREYALERLRESGEEQIVRARHAGHYLGLAEQARPFLEPPQPAWLDRLETEHDNLRAALNTYGAR